MKSKIVLAYSGGLDTSVILKWLQTEYNADVIAYAADLGQGAELDEAKTKAKKLGAKKIYIENLKEEFVKDYVFPMFRCNTIYEGEYLLGTSIARPLIAKRQIEIAKKEKISISKEALNLIVRASDGSVRDSLSILDQSNIFKSQDEIQVEEIINMLGFARQSDLYNLSKYILENNLPEIIKMLNDMYQRGSETSKIIEDLMNIVNWSCKLKIDKNLINDEFNTEEDNQFASYVAQYDHGKLNIFWQSLMKGYDEIKISPHPHTTLEMVLLRCSFLLSDQNSDGSDEKKKSEITQTPSKPSPILDQAVQNKIDAPESLSLKDRIALHQKFFQFYGQNFSPLMAGIIMENCEIIEFLEKEKKLLIHVVNENFEGGEELKNNLKNEFELSIVVKENIDTLESIKMLYKKELIAIETQSEDFQKVLAKFPNAKIIDIEEVERGDQNDG